jgi:hypothetical protein
VAKVSRTDGSLTNYAFGNTIQAPCVLHEPNATNYWGDYDSMSAFNNGSSQPALLRYLTDSTGPTCNGNGLPQHVSFVIGNGSL